MLRNKKSWVIVVGMGIMGLLAPLSVFFAPNAQAAGPEVNPDASLSRVNRPTLLLGGVYFYDSDTTTKDESGNTFNAVGTDCPAKIVYRIVSTESSSTETWTLTYQKKNESGGDCGVDNTKTLSKPANWTERKYVVFAGGSSDGKYISVLPTSSTVFKKGGTYNGDTVYIEQGVDAYSCPLVLVTNSRSTALIPLEKKNNEDDVSNQIKTLFNKELKVPDTACGPTDNDELGIFNRFGLPESYYDAGSEKDHYETTDFGFSGAKIGSATMTVGSIAQVAGIAGQGPLKGGGYDGSSETGELGNTDESSETTSCAIDNIGWIVCPVLNFMSRIVDVAYGQVASWLSVTPLSTTTSAGSDNTMYSAWGVMRNIANIAFVIAFMVIIYSQLTSVGISNYGIKKLLPKIMVAVILVNVSYWVCAIAIDVSNIAGASLYKLFDGDVFSQGIDTSQFEGDISSTGNGWTGIVSALLASAALYLALPALIVALPAALFAIVTVFLVLALRQVLIILLVVISPLAFVALLLPNTEDWFKKWRTLLQTLLLLYPIIAVIFGASAMASTIVMNSAQDVNGDGKVAIQLMGALITVLPLAITPIIMKFGGGVLGRFGGMINNPNKGPFDAMRKRTDKFAGRMRNRREAGGISGAENILKGEGGRLGDANSRRRRVAAAFRSGGRSMLVNADEKDKYAEVGAAGAKRNYVASRASTDDSYAAALAGGNAKVAQQVKDYAIQANAEERVKDIKAASARIANLNNLDIAKIAATGMHEGRQASAEIFAAATHRIQETGSFDERRGSLEFLAQNKDTQLGKDLGNDETLRGEAAQRAIGRGDSNIYGAGFGNQLIAKDGEIKDADSLKAAAVTNAAGGSLSAEHVVQNNMSTKYLVESITASGDANAIAKLKQAAETARTQTTTASKVTGKIDEQFRTIGVGPATGGAPQSPIILPGDPGYSRTGGGPSQQ